MHSPRFLALLDELKQLHVDKSAGYAGAQNVDPWANFRTATDWGVEPWRGALVRFGDKYTRLKNILSNPDNERFGESVHDQAMDMAAYAIIFLCLYEEDPGLPENQMYEPLDPHWDPRPTGTYRQSLEALSGSDKAKWMMEAYDKGYDHAIYTVRTMDADVDVLCHHDGIEDASNCIHATQLREKDTP